MALVPWCDTTQATSILGPAKVAELGLDDAKLLAAAHTLSSYVGLVPGEVPPIARDRYELEKAVAYQAAWMESQPDLFDRLDVSALSQDGQSITPTRHGLVLAPLAARCIRRLSWKGTRGAQGKKASSLPSDYDPTDDRYQWQPLR